VQLPSSGFARGEPVYEAPASDPSQLTVRFEAGSERLAPLAPFAPWDGKDFEECPVLIKVKGKCTTDHISAAGAWLRLRGHLDNISNNMLMGAVNAETGGTNSVQSALTGQMGTVSGVAREYKAAGVRWVVVAESNYGEGSAREHAALEPRHLGGCAIITKSFARIHEANLKKQGLLPLTFVDPKDYDRISGRDRLSLVGLAGLAPGKQVTAVVKPASGAATFEIALNHSLNHLQISYFRAGSALNAMAKKLSS
jgi:aconitate hydratase